MKDKLDKVVVLETSDGSKTLYDRERDVTYRSRHGAVSESRHVFLGGTGLLERTGEWRVMELGFGAAVNFVETVRAFRAQDRASRLIYQSVDWRPVTEGHLQFHDGEGGVLAREAVRGFHDDGGLQRVLSEDGAIELILHPLQWDEVDLEGFEAQAFFHDPFSVRVNPEAWTAESFRRAKSVMATDGRLATYSAASGVKRAMLEAGLFVASLPGPGRKREMTVASKSKEALQCLKNARLIERERYLGEDS